MCKIFKITYAPTKAIFCATLREALDSLILLKLPHALLTTALGLGARRSYAHHCPISCEQGEGRVT